MDSFQFSSGLNLKNPLLMAPMTTSSGTETGGLSKEDVAFLTRRSEGFGAVIIGSHSVSPNGSAFSRGWSIYDNRNHETLANVVKDIQQKNTKVFLQLYHAGRLAQPAFNDGMQPIAPSRVPALRSFASYPKEMTSAEIIEVIDDFRKGTKIAIELGFDGVELHGANTYLIQQFYSPHSNRREDEWGGTREKRLRFPIAVIEACHDEVVQTADRPFVLGYRFSPEEYETPGIRLADTCYLLKHLSQTSLDYLHISISDFRKKSIESESILRCLAGLVANKLPLIGGGNIRTREEAYSVLRDVPLCSIGNAVLIDPDWARKVQQVHSDIQSIISVGEQKQLRIPNNLWETMLKNPLRYFHPNSEGDV